MNESKKKYKGSPKGKEAEKRYNLSDKGHENRRRYNRSEKGKIICRKAAREFYQRHKEDPVYREKIRERNRKYGKSNKGRLTNKKAAKKFRKTPKGKMVNKNRKMKRRQLEGEGKITLGQWEELCKKHDFICHLCGKKIGGYRGNLGLEFPSMDHIIPLSKGGKHDISNVAPAHTKCNILRRDKSVEEFKKEHGYK